MRRFSFSLGAPCRRPIIRPERFPSSRIRAPPDYENGAQRPLKQPTCCQRSAWLTRPGMVCFSRTSCRCPGSVKE